MQEEQNQTTATIQSDKEHVGNELLGAVSENIIETELSTEVLDILPSTEVKEEN